MENIWALGVQPFEKYLHIFTYSPSGHTALNSIFAHLTYTYITNTQFANYSFDLIYALLDKPINYTTVALILK